MNREIAVRVSQLVQEGTERIRQSVEVVRQDMSDEDFKDYCRTVGSILADIQLELLRPFVYRDFPELEPAPATDADREFISRLEPKFREAAKRAERDDEAP